MRKAVVVGTLLTQSLLVLTAGGSAAHATEPTVAQSTAAEHGSPSNSTAASAPTITFADALQRATANHPQTQAAFTALGVAHQDLVQSRAGLLPNVSYNMQAVYTEPTPHGIRVMTLRIGPCWSCAIINARSFGSSQIPSSPVVRPITSARE
jgi:outer membrane protein TolC